MQHESSAPSSSSPSRLPVKRSVLSDLKVGACPGSVQKPLHMWRLRVCNVSLASSRTLAACNGTEYFIASWIPVFLIEKVGRRSLMLFGAVGMSLSMAVLAIANSINEGKTAAERNTAAGIVAAAFLFVFNSFFAVGWLGMTWL